MRKSILIEEYSNNSMYASLFYRPPRLFLFIFQKKEWQKEFLFTLCLFAENEVYTIISTKWDIDILLE